MRKNKLLVDMDVEIWKEAKLEAIRDEKKLADWIGDAILYYKNRKLAKIDLTDLPTKPYRIPKENQ